MLLLQAGYSVNGFQDTMLAPVLKKNDMWHIPAEGFKNQTSPSTNIQYNKNNQWVPYFHNEDGDVYLIDSDLDKQLLDNTISSNLWSRKIKTKSSDSICTTAKQWP